MILKVNAEVAQIAHQMLLYPINYISIFRYYVLSLLFCNGKSTESSKTFIAQTIFSHSKFKTESIEIKTKKKTFRFRRHMEFIKKNLKFFFPLYWFSTSCSFLVKIWGNILFSPPAKREHICFENSFGYE